MERSGHEASKASDLRCPSARRLGSFITGVIFLAGCHAFELPNRQILPTAGTSYSTLLPAMQADTPEAIRADFETAKIADERGQERCIDLYCQAALRAWRQLECGEQSSLPIYQEGLAGMLSAANHYGRLDPRRHLSLTSACGGRIVPIFYYGFAWKPSEFCEVVPAADYYSRDFRHHYYTPGIGMSLVAARRASYEESFFPATQSFPVTAVVRPTQEGPVLEFYNPLMFDSLPVGPATFRLDRDLTASLAYTKDLAPRKYFSAFLDPGEKDFKPKLIMLEPYQPGKIPVVFIHGLGSDPLTWADATNFLRAQGDLYRRYQFWYFRYPTGGDLLRSAAALREKFGVVREVFDPNHHDPALEQMVLVGHSMGGLVAKLQVTYSYDLLWRRAASQPLEAVRTSLYLRNQLERSFFFDPSPLVKRVVFIATPHHGTNMAERLFGRAASTLVHYPPEQEAVYRDLMNNNCDIFTSFAHKGQPTTIDLLEPDNPLLEAMAQMPFNRCVRLHSIIGDKLMTLSGEVSDGVVPVSSARLAGVCSERVISASHEKTNKVDAALFELARILRVHALEYDSVACLGPNAGQNTP